MKNKTYISDKIKNLIKKYESVTIAYMDIDFFTNINNKIGYEEGNKVLQQIYDDLSKYKDIFAERYDSDEFIFIFIDKNTETIKAFLDDYRKHFRKSRFIGKHPYENVRITFSMGVANTNKYIKDAFLLIKSAQTALLSAKKNGRNRIEFVSDYEIGFIKNRGICTTVIGKNLKGNCIDGCMAFTADISEPYGVDFDTNGDILFVDRSNHQIKRVHKNKVYNVAGNGGNGFSGDGKNAIDAVLSKPSGVCVHSSGKIYIADTGNHAIRKIENGIISTVAGLPDAGYSGDGSNAIHARFNRPGGVVVDNEENVYTNDYGNNVIRKIDKNGIAATVAGNGDYGFSGDGGPAVFATLDKPYGMCLGNNGKHLFIADYGNHAIREVDLTTGIIKTLCGTGKPGYSGDGSHCLTAELNGPFWVYIFNNSLYIADANNHCIRRICMKTEVIETVAGNGSYGYVDHIDDRSKIRFNIPAGIAVNKKYIYVADYGNNAIRRVKNNCY